MSLVPHRYALSHSSTGVLKPPLPTRLVGIDTGKGMIEIAPAALQAWAKTTGKKDVVSSKKSRFVVGDSANLSGVLEDHAVSLVIAATAAHWFDHAKTWRELTRVVRPGGAVLYWTYGENYLPGHPGLQGDIFKFMQADGIGPYFSQPGRSLLTNLLKDIPLPHDAALLGEGALPQDLVDQWDQSSVLYEKHPLEAEGIADTSWIASSSDPPHQVDLRRPFRLEQVMTWTDYEGYIRTASALHSYLKAHPEEQEGEGDIADRFIKKLRGKVAEERARGVGTEEGLPDDKIRVAWPLGIKGIRKKPA